MSKASKVRKIKRVLKPLSALSESKNNPRAHFEEQTADMVRSIDQFGFTMPILIKSDGEIIAGHGRYLASKAIAERDSIAIDDYQVPCIVAQGWTPEQIRAFNIADNKLGEGSSWNHALLSEQLIALADGGFDMRSLGVDKDEYADFAKQASQASQASSTPESDPDPDPESKQDKQDRLKKEQKSRDLTDSVSLNQRTITCRHCNKPFPVVAS